MFSRSDDAERYASNIGGEVYQTGNLYGEEYEWGFFKIRGFKKGTMHFTFRDEKLWYQFNTAVAKIKGWQLPAETDTKVKGTEKRKK